MQRLILILLFGWISVSLFSCTSRQGSEKASDSCCIPLSGSGFHFTGKGFEPGWLLQIDPKKIFFVDNYGSDTLICNKGTLIHAGKRIMITTQPENSSPELFIMITKKPAQDPAGRSHPYAVFVEKGGETRRGWGDAE